MFDCVTFVASVYLATGILTEAPAIPADYAVYGRGSEMKDVICQVIESTEAFEIGSLEPKHGDLLVLSEGERGHHAGIYLEGGWLAHCLRGRGVVIDSFVPPFSGHVYRLYTPLI